MAEEHLRKKPRLSEGPQCFAFNCYNYRNVHFKERGITFHCFPKQGKEPDRYNQWVKACRRSDSLPSKWSLLCSDHFTTAAMDRTGQTVRLREGAVPTIFNFPAHLKKETEPKQTGRSKAAASDDTVSARPQTEQRQSRPRRTARSKSAELPSADVADSTDTEPAPVQVYTERRKTARSKVAGIPPHHASDNNHTATAHVQRHSLQPIDELFLFQMYLAAGLKERDLANRFNIHPSTVSRIITSWTNYLYTLLGSLCIWIDAEDIIARLPDDFKDFPDTRVIVDCTELKCQTPASPLLQSEMFSKYKSHCTMKGLIGMAPHGAVTFVSSLYEGSINDKELFVRSGLSYLLTEDMAIMVDKGFLIPDCVKCKVYCPPFLSKKSQMPAQNVLQTQKVARLRVHVARVIRRVKENKLFDSVIPLSIAGSINELFAVSCLLVNYQNKPLVRAWAK